MKTLRLSVMCLTAMATLVASSTFSDANSAQPRPWNYGDLGLEELLYDEQELSSFIRARTEAQLAEHARRRVQVTIHKSMKAKGYQYLTVTVDGSPQFEAPVSTAWERVAPAPTGSYRAWTPPGKFMPDGMQVRRYSNKWRVWLQYVIRFNGGIWMHATTPDHYLELGAPASGGCVRMLPSDAKTVYELVEKYGMNELAITVLNAGADEAQVPWKVSRKQIPPALQAWRAANGVR